MCACAELSWTELSWTMLCMYSQTVLCVCSRVCERVSDCFLSMIDVTYVLNTFILYRQHTYGMYLSVPHCVCVFLFVCANRWFLLLLQFRLNLLCIGIFFRWTSYFVLIFHILFFAPSNFQIQKFIHTTNTSRYFFTVGGRFISVAVQWVDRSHHITCKNNLDCVCEFFGLFPTAFINIFFMCACDVWVKYNAKSMHFRSMNRSFQLLLNRQQ